MTPNILQGQVAIVTGGGRGIGKAAAEELGALGATVIITAARNAVQIESVAAGVRAVGAEAVAIACDVADRAQVDALTQKVLDQHGKINIIVNNAGVIWPVDNLIQSDPEAWAYNIQVNLLGPYYLVRNVLPLMVDQHYGRIVHVSSGAAINPIVGASAYSTAKAGMDMFTRAVAQELVESGVSITSFHPGMVDTEMQVDLRSIDAAGATFDLSRFHSAYEEGLLRSPIAVSHAITWLAGPWSGEYSGKIFKITDEEWMQQVDRDLGLA